MERSSGKKRLESIISRTAESSIAWTTLVDDVSRSLMPDEYKTIDVIDFYRKIGCDVFQFSNYGLTSDSSVTYPFTRKYSKISTNTVEKNGVVSSIRSTPWGILKGDTVQGHPITYPVQSVETLKVLLKIWEDVTIEKQDGCLLSYHEMVKRLKDDGIYVMTVDPSPVQELLEYEMGMEAFYYHYTENKTLLLDLLAVMQEKRMAEYEIIAADFPGNTVVSVENTSTMMISPIIYEELSLKQVTGFIDTMHKHGKIALLHMCGHLRGLLSLIKKTNCDGIHALSPPPIGDTPFELALDELGKSLIIIGTADSTLFHDKKTNRTAIRSMLDSIFTEKVKKANFLLWIVTDGIPADVEKFFWVNEWFEDFRKDTND